MMTILKGLKMIDQAGLPHPEWEFVETSQDLKRFPEIKDYVGWTIRTVHIKNGSWKNLYVNWLPKKQVPQKIDTLQKQHQNSAIFVVYPSWKWKRGGTLLVENNRVIIETVKGPVVELMRHGRVDAHYHYQRGRLVDSQGPRNFLTVTDRKKILEATRRIKEKDIILEWAITTQNRFIFYRIEKIKDAGKLLKIKYLDG